MKIMILVFYKLAYNPRPCRFKDSRCIQERINYFLNTKYNGNYHKVNKFKDFI